MKVFLLLPTLAALLNIHTNTYAQALPDTLDVLHYNLQAQMGTTRLGQMTATATLSIVKLSAMDTCMLELQSATIGDVSVNGDIVSHCYDNTHLRFPIGNIVTGDTFSVSVQYGTYGYVENYGFGGLHLDGDIYYNLAAGIFTDPHPLGRAVLPCRDNFHDKATYRFEVTTAPQWTGLCSGQLVSSTTNSDSTTTSIWELQEPIPTYIISLSAAPFSFLHDTIQGDTTARATIGASPSIPITIGWQNRDSNIIVQKFEIMHDVVPNFERHFGPYRWHTIGYIGTPQGSMEHANNIHLTNQCIASTSEPCQATTIHEFGHSWFGNLVTCQTSDDMWFNEGGASFCEEVGLESAYDKATADGYFRKKLDNTIRTSHITDRGWNPLYAQTSHNVYGSTTYDKGACVWHSLRSYLGDSLFYASMARFFARNAFGNIESHAFCDSLSAISGVNLDEFFRFHVFTPGFTDFELMSLVGLESSEDDTYKIAPLFHQNTRGTEEKSYRNKVPVTFFGKDLKSAKRIFTVDWNAEGRQQDTNSIASATLPFAPEFAVVDLENEYSYASLSDTMNILRKNVEYELPLCYFKAKAQNVDTTSPTFLGVTHHYTKPSNTDDILSATPSIVRISDHYWTVAGLMPGQSRMWGFFGYCKGFSETGGSYLDQDLIVSTNSVDSLRLVYRPTPYDAWQVVSRRRDGNAASGYAMHTKLKLGEYALAIIDTTRLGIETPRHTGDAAPSASLYPNPSDGTMVIRTHNAPPTFSVVICDAKGQQVFRQGSCHNGSVLHLDLPKGVYIATLRDTTSRKAKAIATTQIVIR